MPNIFQNFKGPESIRGLFGLRFSENMSFVFCVVYIHIIKAVCHSYPDFAPKSVCMFTVAMETSINKVKMPFCKTFAIFCCFRSF